MKGLTPIILILVSIGVFFIYIDPQYKKLKELTKNHDDNEAVLDLAEQLQRKREVLLRDFRSISPPQKEELHKLLPDTVDNVRLLLDINELVKEFGIKLQGTSISTIEPDGSVAEGLNVGKVQLNFSVGTSYETYLELLRALEKSLRIIDIKTLTIGDTDSGSDFYTFGVTFETYWLSNNNN